MQLLFEPAMLLTVVADGETLYALADVELDRGDAEFCCRHC